MRVRRMALPALFLMLGLCLAGCDVKYITIETPLTDYYHKNVYEVETEFKDMGFTDITKKSTQNKLGSEYNNNVKVVTIDGKQDYAVGDEVSSNSPVEIEYLGTYSTNQYTSSEPIVDSSDTTTDNSTEEKDTSSSNDTIVTTQQDSSSETAETAFPSKTVSFDIDDGNGYTIGISVEIGYWVKADDDAAVMKAWEQAGGEGDPPSMKTFSSSAKSGSAAILFADVKWTNKTEGFDLTPDNFTGLTMNYLGAYSDDKDVFVRADIVWQLGSKFRSPQDSMTVLIDSNNQHMTVALLLENVFTPKNGADGMGMMEHVRLSVPYKNGTSFYSYGERNIIAPIAWEH